MAVTGVMAAMEETVLITSGVPEGTVAMADRAACRGAPLRQVPLEQPRRPRLQVLRGNSATRAPLAAALLQATLVKLVAIVNGLPLGT